MYLDKDLSSSPSSKQNEEDERWMKSKRGWLAGWCCFKKHFFLA